MKKIFEIFKNDLKNLSKSKMAIVIIIGILIIPGIYAWLNIGSNWGPYDNTGNLPVAVVNKDKGTTILGSDVNMGNEMVEALKDNKSLKWVFTNEKKAKDMVKKSKYYGVIVVPENFSSNIKTIMDEGKPKKPVFDFYVNNKRNPIAPIIVNKAAGAIQESVNQSFVRTVLYKAVDKVEDLDVLTKSSETVDGLVNKLYESKDKIEQLRSIIRMTDSAASTAGHSLSAVRKFLPAMSDISNTSKQGITEMKNAVKSFDETYDGIERDLSSIVADSDAIIKDSLDIMNKTDASNVVQNFKTVYDRFEKSLAILKRLDNVLVSINKVANLSGVHALEGKITKLIEKIENAQNLLLNTDDAIKNLQEIKQKINDINDSINSIKNDYQGRVKSDLSNIYKSASNLVNNVSGIMLNMNVSLDNVDLSMQHIIRALESGGKLSVDIDSTLVNFESHIDKLIDVVKSSKDSELYKDFVNLLKNSPDDVADFLSTPVETKQIELYPIEAYGSKMAPFYSILACWVGCTVLTAILKIGVKKSKVTKDANGYQLFFGRFMLFGSLAMIQGLVIGLGDLILQVQTINPFLFLITLMISSLTFMGIIYSLASALGKVGQALSIVIMVLQVAGSGGTFPIELLPRLFQILQPFMPFNPALNAVRETVGGFYKNDYIIGMFGLLCHLVIMLAVGVIMCKYTSDIKEKVEKSLHKTGIIE